MAELVTKLFDRYGVGVLGFDVVGRARYQLRSSARCARAEDFKRIAGFQDAYKPLRPALDFDGRFAEGDAGAAGGAATTSTARTAPCA